MLDRLPGIVALAAGILLPSTCATPEPDAIAFQVSEQLKKRKAGSIREWNGMHSDSQAVIEWTSAATAPIVSPPGLLEVAVDPEGRTGRIKLTKPFDHAGSSVALTEDGYFLTAAHCVSQECEMLVVSRENDRPLLVVSPVRVIWMALDDELDLALVHSPVRPRSIGIADPKNLAEGLPVASLGSARGPAVFRSAAAGKVVAVSAWRTHPRGIRYRIVQHDVPLGLGDSGGPLFDSRGALLGVNTSIETRILSLGKKVVKPYAYRGSAVSPDWRQVQDWIHADREGGGGAPDARP